MEAPFLALINSEWWYGRGPDGVEDQLLANGWLESFLERWGYSEAGMPNARQRAELIRLRTLLRRVVSAIAEGRKPTARDVRSLGEVSGAALFRKRVSAAGASLGIDVVPVHKDWRWVLSEIAASLAELIEAGEAERLKLCANGECRWAFYDESKNRRRRWCGHASCGDLDKVRRFRERQRRSTRSR